MLLSVCIVAEHRVVTPDRFFNRPLTAQRVRHFCVAHAIPGRALLSNYIHPASASNCSSLYRPFVMVFSIAVLQRPVYLTHKCTQRSKACTRFIGLTVFIGIDQSRNWDAATKNQFAK